MGTEDLANALAVLIERAANRATEDPFGNPMLEWDYAEPHALRGPQGYAREHAEIFAPMRRLFDLVREIAVAITMMSVRSGEGGILICVSVFLYARPWIVR